MAHVRLIGADRRVVTIPGFLRQRVKLVFVRPLRYDRIDHIGCVVLGAAIGIVVAFGSMQFISDLVN